MIRARGTPVFGSRSFCASAKYETVLPSAFRRLVSRRYMPLHDNQQLQPPQAITAETCAYTISTLTPPSPTDLQGKRLPSPVQMPTNCGTPVEQGWPIATGIVEGACRHLVKDRMDITGARWGLAGAESILKLRAIIANGDYQEYWRFHLAQERHHLHEARYRDHAIPTA